MQTLVEVFLAGITFGIFLIGSVLVIFSFGYLVGRESNRKRDKD